jgi:uncharacterized membrane protein
MALRVVITVLCGVGLYASVFMLRKGIRAQQGLLTEPSVVQTPRARLFGGIPNAAFGLAYYPLAAIGVWIPGSAAAIAVAAGALAAAMTSVVLAYSLIFVTRMPCRFCWTSHVLNWALAALIVWRAIGLR